MSKQFDVVDDEEIMNSNEEFEGMEPEKAHPVRAFGGKVLGFAKSTVGKVIIGTAIIGGAVVAVVAVVSQISGNVNDAISGDAGAEATGDSEGVVDGFVSDQPDNTDV